MIVKSGAAIWSGIFSLIFISGYSNVSLASPVAIKKFSSLKLIQVKKTDKQPKQVCFHQNRKEIYVASMNDASGRGGPILSPGSLEIFSIPELKSIHKQRARTAVECLVEFDTLYYSDMFRDEIVAFDLEKRKITFRIPIKSKKEKNYRNARFRYMPKMIVRGPGKNELTISTWLAGLSVIDSRQGKWIKTIPEFCKHPRGLLYNKNGKLIVMCYGVPHGPGQMVMLDPQKNFKIIQRKITGGSPRHIVHVDSNRALVSNLGKGRIVEIDTNNLNVLRSLNIGGQPNTIALDRDRKHLYVSQRGKNRLSVISLDTWKVVKKYNTGSYPTGLGVSPNGKYVVITNFHEASMHFFQVIRK